MEFVLVPDGEFTMGAGVGDGDDDERPAGTVRLRGYYIGRFEVTNAEFDLFAAGHSATHREYSPSGRCPAIAVSWHQATAFCSWLSDKEGVVYRLPTEAEWEKAARGVDARTYPWGAAAPGAGGTWRCNFAPGSDKDSWGRDGYQYASPVGSFADGASPFGAADLAGTVWEWCLDWYAADYYARRPGVDPAGPGDGTKRAMRGGSFTSGATVLRCANRMSKPPEFIDANLGFRCVRELDDLYRDE